MRTYLDHNATSPLRPEARAAVLDAVDVGNPSSVHREGQRARGKVENARAEIAHGLGVKATDVVFCSGATEAINLAIYAAVSAGRRRLIVSATEHEAVFGAAKSHGCDVLTVPVDGDGLVDLDAMAALLARENEPALVAVMAANNETGVLQPVADIVALAHEANAWVLIDGVQVIGRLPFDACELSADLVAISAHKLGGPKGAGALYVRPGLPVPALVGGGGQEQGRRGGTENVSGLAGFGAAMGAAIMSREDEAIRLVILRDRLEAELKALATDVVIFGETVARLPNTSAFAVPGQSAETLLIALDLKGVAVSSGAACSSGKIGASHVLAAMNVEDGLARSAIRVSLGWSTTQTDIENFCEALTAVLRQRTSSSAAA